jgi:hypothetical protein
MGQLSKACGSVRAGTPTLFVVFLLAPFGCGKSFVEADAIHKDEVAKLGALQAEVADKKDKTTAEMRAVAASALLAEVERRKPLLAEWYKAHPRPIGNHLPTAVPFDVPDSEEGRLVYRHARDMAALIMEGILPDEPFRMEVWVKRRMSEPDSAFLRVARASMHYVADIVLLDEVENGGFSGSSD